MRKIKSVRISVKRPDKVRRTFAVTIDTIYFDGSRGQVSVKDERLDSINRNLGLKLISVAGAYAEVKGVLVPALKREYDVKIRQSLEQQISDNNKKVYTAFWADKYAQSDLVNVASTRNDLLGALRAIEPESITSADKVTLRNKLAALPIQQQRRYCIRINQLLDFLGRGFSIDKKRRQQAEVDYVTWAELQKIIPHIYSPEVQNLAIALWATGVRIGEAFAPGFANLKSNNTIYISKQMDLQLVIRDIKNRKPHHTVLLPEGLEAYKAWCDVENKEQFRNSAINQIIMASRKAFPNKKPKQVSAHDLRHSYAIHWLGLGASLTQIAACLGDTPQTVQVHYTGFVMSDEAIAGMHKLLPDR
jgi:integrase